MEKTAVTNEVTKKALSILRNAKYPLLRPEGSKNSAKLQTMDKPSLFKLKLLRKNFNDECFSKNIIELTNNKKGAQIIIPKNKQNATNVFLHEIGHAISNVNKPIPEEFSSENLKKLPPVNMVHIMLMNEFEANKRAKYLIERYSKPENLEKNLNDFEHTSRKAINTYKKLLYHSAFNEELDRNAIDWSPLIKKRPELLKMNTEQQQPILMTYVKKHVKNIINTNPRATTKFYLKADPFGDIK